ncbi:MAG: trimethylamine methyltransferase family protein [Pseudomonadota bacterium]
MSTPNKRSGRRRSASAQTPVRPPLSLPGLPANRLHVLDQSDLQQIYGAVISILEKTGLGLAPSFVVDRVKKAGGYTNQENRLCFPEKLVEESIAGISKGITLYGRQQSLNMELSGGNVYCGTGGAAPLLLDTETDQYRDSSLRDLYNVARLVDDLDNVHFLSRPLVARDMPTEQAMDINTAYACLAGSSKHVCVSASNGENAQSIADLCHIVAGSADAFRRAPFLSLHVNHVTPPLRFGEEACEVLKVGAENHIPVHCNIFGQVGASSPVTFAGAIAQTAAESIAGMIYCWLINPEVKLIFGPRPMITDLRTGGMAGGAGEQGMIIAAMTQVARYFGFSNSCIAGAADSKIADAQSGHEKSFTVNMAAQSGCNLITQACGMQAGLMGVSLESYIIDNDMLGGIMSSLRPLPVNESTLATDLIDSVVNGPAHFLGEASTINRMKSDFEYPQVADRRSVTEWQQEGSEDIRAKARRLVQESLQKPDVNHIPADIDEHIRSRFDIRLAIGR